jgi:hypothetical protein
MGTSYTKLRLFFHKASVIINTLYPPLHATLYAGRVKLSLKRLSSSRTLFQLVVARKMASSEFTLQGAKEMEVGGC